MKTKFWLAPKGQLISKRFFEVVDFLQKTNENNSHSSKNEFIRSFFGGNGWPQKPFRNYLTFSIWFNNRFSSQIWRLYNPDHTVKVLSLPKCRLIGTSFSSGYIMTLAATQLLFFRVVISSLFVVFALLLPMMHTASCLLQPAAACRRLPAACLLVPIIKLAT